MTANDSIEVCNPCLHVHVRVSYACCLCETDQPSLSLLKHTPVAWGVLHRRERWTTEKWARLQRCCVVACLPFSCSLSARMLGPGPASFVNHLCVCTRRERQSECQERKGEHEQMCGAASANRHTRDGWLCMIVMACITHMHALDGWEDGWMRMCVRVHVRMLAHASVHCHACAGVHVLPHRHTVAIMLKAHGSMQVCGRVGGRQRRHTLLHTLPKASLTQRLACPCSPLCLPHTHIMLPA